MSDAVLKSVLSPSHPDAQIWSFFCPGCEQLHVIHTAGSGNVWGFNGDVVLPTFTPSYLLTRPADPGAQPPYDVALVCHSFITAGQIAYCGDTTHKLSGKTVPLPPWKTGF